MSIRFVARIVSISESERLFHRSLLLIPLQTPVAVEERDLFVQNGIQMLRGHSPLSIDVPDEETKDLRPGLFVAFEMTALSEDDSRRINEENTRLKAQQARNEAFSPIAYGIMPPPR